MARFNYNEVIPMIQKHRRRNQKGFTLVEVLITIILIGVIAAIVYPLINNFVSSKANAQEMMSVAQNIVRSASMMNQTMRAPTAVTSNPLTAAGNNLLDAVIMGDKVTGIISATYAPRYATSGIRPMSDAVTTITRRRPGGGPTPHPPAGAGEGLLPAPAGWGLGEPNPPWGGLLMLVRLI